MFTCERILSVDDDADFERLAMECMRFIRTRDAYPWSSLDLTDEERIAELRTHVKEHELNPRTPQTFAYKMLLDGYAVGSCYGFAHEGVFYASIAFLGYDSTGSRRWIWDRSQQIPLKALCAAHGITTYMAESHAANMPMRNYITNAKGIKDFTYRPAAHDEDIDRVVVKIF